MVNTAGRAGSPAVHRATRILGELAMHDEPLNVSELSRRVQVPKSSLSDICKVLVDGGMLSRGLDGGLRLGPGITRIARGLVGGSRLLEVFPRICAGARELDGRTVVLAVLRDLDAAYVAVRPGDRPLSLTLKPGMRLPAWSTGTGRALLSALPVDVVERMHSGPVPESPSGHRFRLKDLTAAVTLAQSRGYASSAELGEMSLTGTAALVEGLHGCIAAVGSIADGTRSDEPSPADDSVPIRALAARLATAIRD
ncbi:DNA-binding transcriptional regulator, IclR family [Thermomonospora echinospora]|uniref:DNA-binding transcriptional regulator, IclR family n=1 Tax=Thermomonospora echinospora TaxID=1992 RepID=A0A1H6E1T9_9ACTN|nr:MarR family transcriptional regulator [Thermomonospora echinospora]SEG91542.1 DNA-binding transcriptional regulator, IclR family [Thermomonospora echinospora]